MAKARYGAAHRRERERWRALVDGGGIPCCLCGKELQPGAPFDLDHLPGTTWYRGAACPSCNRADGGRRRHQAEQARRRWVL